MYFVVDKEDEGVRLDRFLSVKNTEIYTLSFILKMIEEGYVLYNGSTAKPSIKLKAGDYIVLNEKEPEFPEIN